MGSCLAYPLYMLVLHSREWCCRGGSSTMWLTIRSLEHYSSGSALPPQQELGLTKQGFRMSEKIRVESTDSVTSGVPRTMYSYKELICFSRAVSLFITYGNIFKRHQRNKSLDSQASWMRTLHLEMYSKITTAQTPIILFSILNSKNGESKSHCPCKKICSWWTFKGERATLIWILVIWLSQFVACLSFTPSQWNTIGTYYLFSFSILAFWMHLGHNPISLSLTFKPSIEINVTETLADHISLADI